MEEIERESLRDILRERDFERERERERASLRNLGIATPEAPDMWVGFCLGRLTVADIALPAAIEVVNLPDADAVVALDIKCVNIKINVDYQLCKNRLNMMLELS